MGTKVLGFEGRRVRRVYPYMGEEKERCGGGGESERGRLQEGDGEKVCGELHYCSYCLNHRNCLPAFPKHDI